jgi:hypothetical protein
MGDDFAILGVMAGIGVLLAGIGSCCLHLRIAFN